MNCVDNFTIVQGIDNEFILTIKQTGNTLPMQITDNDTFSAILKALDDSQTIKLPVSVVDAANGKIVVKVSKKLANTLISKKGDSIDLYYTKPTYKLLIDCDTVNNGKFIARIPYVYVE